MDLEVIYTTCMCCSEQSIWYSVKCKWGPGEEQALPLLQTRATWAFAPADLKVLKASSADPNAAERLWHTPLGK